MSLIDSTYFTGLISIPTSKYADDIQTYIDRYEEKVLTDLLGYTLYYQFIEGLEEPVIDQKWLDLRDGKTYEVDGKLVKWNGLINEAKESLISYYIFWNYKTENHTITTNVGGVDLKSENSTRVVETQKLTQVWAKMLSLYGKHTDSDLKPTALNFLNEFESDYPDWEFSLKGNINYFDI